MVTRIKSSQITDGTVLNADVNASAAIAATKVSGLATSATTDTTNAANIGSGILPDARFPSTLPAVSGSNLTDIPGGMSDLAFGQGTWPNAGTSGTSKVSTSVSIGTSPSFAKGGIATIHYANNSNQTSQMAYCAIDSLTGTGVSHMNTSGKMTGTGIGHGRGTDTMPFKCNASTGVTMTVGFAKGPAGGNVDTPFEQRYWDVTWIG